MGFPSQDLVVFKIYWSKLQLKVISHPNLRETTKFANKLWTASPEIKICLEQNISYADKLSIREPGDTGFSLGPHADCGSLEERWEDSEYSKCYASTFEGHWEDYNPYDTTHRISVDMCMYESTDNFTVFRIYQAYLGLSEIEPNKGGMKFAPAVKLVTAYYMLKPFFDENNQLRMNSENPEVLPGKGLEFNDNTHPELDLDIIMVSTPKVDPGNMVFWHCDLIHLVDPIHTGKNDSSVFYIPSAPLCDLNINYVLYQREAFLKGLAAPYFPRFLNGIAETQHIGRGKLSNIENFGRKDALKEFALDKFDEKPEYSIGAKSAISSANDILFY